MKFTSASVVSIEEIEKARESLKFELIETRRGAWDQNAKMLDEFFDLVWNHRQSEVDEFKKDYAQLVKELNERNKECIGYIDELNRIKRKLKIAIEALNELADIGSSYYISGKALSDIKHIDENPNP